MLSKYGLPSIIFCSAAAAIFILLAVVFVAGATKRKHKRTAADRLGLAFGSLMLIAAVIVGALAAIFEYQPFDIVAYSLDGKLSFAHGDKTLFDLPLPKAGGILDIFDKIGIVSVIAPAAVFAAAVAALAAVDIKSRGAVKVSQEDISEPVAPVEREEAPAGQADAVSVRDGFAAGEISEDTQTVEEFPAEQAKNILEQIDKLVTDSPAVGGEKSGGEDIDALLRKAIDEGTALCDDFADIAEKASSTRASDSVARESTAADGEDLFPPDKIEKAVTFAEFDSKRKEIEVTDYEQQDGASAQRGARVIVRRPVAKSVDEMRERAEEIREEDAERTDAERGKNISKQKKPDKTVVAEKANLPLKRKYVILNRRNAATVFNDYLNSKRDSEKEELTGSLNTVIFK